VTDADEKEARDAAARADPFSRPQLHPLDLLLLAAPVALAATILQWNGAVLFFASGLAIVPLARTIGVATE